MNENLDLSTVTQFDLESILKKKTNRDETIQEINSKIGSVLLLFINHVEKETW
jgi:hypothetical protein